MAWKILYIGAEIRFQLGENGKSFEASQRYFVNWSGIYSTNFFVFATRGKKTLGRFVSDANNVMILIESKKVSF